MSSGYPVTGPGTMNEKITFGLVVCGGYPHKIGAGSQDTGTGKMLVIFGFPVSGFPLPKVLFNTNRNLP